MKNILLIITLIFGLNLTSKAQAELVAHYKLDESAGTDVADASGNEYHALITKGTEGWTSEGEIDGALDFDGTTKIAIPAPDLGLTVDAGSVSLWAKSAEPTGIYTMFWAGAADAGGGFGAEEEIHLHLESPVADVWTGGECSFFVVTPEGEDNVHLFSDPDKDTGEGAGVPPVSPTLINDEEWHHIVATWGDGFLTLYIDNIQLMQKEYVSGGYNLDFMYLGEMADDGTRAFTGSLDDVQIFDGPLDIVQIDNLFNKVVVGVNPVAGAQTFDLNAYPSPAQDVLNVSFNTVANQNATVSLVNIAGQTVLSNSYVTSSINKEAININSLESGIYMLKLEINNQVTYTKVIVD